MKREVRDLKSLKPLREGQGQTISCTSTPGSGLPLSTWGLREIWHAGVRGLDVRPHTNQDPQKTTLSVKTFVQAARKLTCLHMDSRWEDIWTLGLTWD